MPSGVTCIDEHALFVAEFAGTDELLRDMLTAPVAIAVPAPVAIAVLTAPVAIAVWTAPVTRHNLGCTGRIS